MRGKMLVDEFENYQTGMKRDATDVTDSPYQLYIPPRLKGQKKKAKPWGERRQYENVWTILYKEEKLVNHQSDQKQPNQSPVYLPIPKSVVSVVTDETSSFSVSPTNENEIDTHIHIPTSEENENETCEKLEHPELTNVDDRDGRPSFFDNPIFDSEALQKWSLPRVSLWCTNPKCGVNVQLSKETASGHTTRFCSSGSSATSSATGSAVGAYASLHFEPTEYQKLGLFLNHNAPVSDRDLSYNQNWLQGFYHFENNSKPLIGDCNRSINSNKQQRRLHKFCSSQKISLIVSIISLMIAVAVIIALVFMKTKISHKL